MKYCIVRQTDQTDCAAACLATISLYYGLEISITKLRDTCGTDIKGTNLNGLTLGANKLGFDVKRVRISNELLDKEKLIFPFIAHGVNKYGMTHFVVVYKITKKYVIVADPARKEKKISRDEFNNFYDGVCVFLKPNNDFVGGKIKTSGILSIFIKMMMSHKKLFISAIVSSFILTILGITSNFFNQILIDEILPFNLKNQLVIFCIGFLFISLINIILGAIRQHILLHLSQKIDIPLTLGYFKHILSLPFNFFSTRKTGDIIARFQDAGTIKNVVSSIALSILMDVSLVFIVGIVLGFMNIKLFAIIILLTIINIILIFIFKHPYKNINQIQMEQGAKLNSTMIETLSSIELIKSNSIENERIESIENDFIDVVKTSYKENVLSNAQGVISNAVSVIGNLVIMWIGANSVMDGNITLGALMTFTSMSGFFMDPVGRLVGLQFQIQEASIAMKRLTEIYEVEPEKLGLETETSINGDINISNLTFSYGCRKPVLDNIDITIKKGEKIAFVGESGSGKTTLVKMMLGLYEPNVGEISFDDKKICEIGLMNLRKRIAYVSQNIELFSGTIKQNLLLGNMKEDFIDKAIKLSNCDFVYKFPAGIDTYLEEAGANLSGGERQRLGIARALMKDSDLFIFDEATSNLDFLSEMKIYNNLFNSNIDKTMIFIAHRLSTIRRCDKIFVFDKGIIAESGNHNELLEKKGLYYKLWSSQIGIEEYVNNAVEEVCYE